MRRKLAWFTFVEMIVVITILVVLSAIWFLSYTSYLWESRNAKRISNLTNVYDLFQFYKTSAQLPLPENYLQLSFSWEVIWYQWYLSSQILSDLNIKEYLWKDPKYWDYYTYYLTRNWRYFQFLWYLEDESSYEPIIVQKTYAMIPNYNRVFVIWDSIWVVTDKDTNKPIQDLYSGNLDFKTFLWAFILNVNDTLKVLWDNITLGVKLKYMSENWIQP